MTQIQSLETSLDLVREAAALQHAPADVLDDRLRVCRLLHRHAAEGNSEHPFDFDLFLIEVSRADEDDAHLSREVLDERRRLVTLLEDQVDLGTIVEDVGVDPSSLTRLVNLLANPSLLNDDDDEEEI